LLIGPTRDRAGHGNARPHVQDRQFWRASACEPASYLSHVRGEALSQRATVKLGD
jgi:hypothetical protein